MKFLLPLIAVKDVETAKDFYAQLFDQKVVCDLGKNVTFSGGFAIQEDFAWLVGLESDSVLSKSHNMELYFEVDDFDAFMDKLNRFPDINFVHPPKTYEWKQQVVRIYDPDWHIIEIGESMEVIAKRYLAAGYSVEQTAEEIQHPVDFVRHCQAEMTD